MKKGCFWKRGQVFYMDLMISVAIFGAAVVLFLALGNNIEPEQDIFDLLVTDSESISSSLLSEGAPYSWAPDNVSKIGIVDDSYRLNASKVSMLMSTPSETTTNLFGTNSNYAIFFRDKHGNVLNINGCAFSNTGLVVENISDTLCENFTITPDNHLVSVERLVMHNSEIIKIAVQTWI